MSKLVNGMMVGLVAFILLLSLFWYMTEIRRKNQIEVLDLGTRWGAVDGSSTEVVTDVKFFNSHHFDVKLVGLQSWVLLNGDRIPGTAPTNVSSLAVPAQTQRAVVVTARVPSATVADWFTAHLGSGEDSQLTIEGNASFVANGENVNVPFSNVYTAKTGLLAGLEHDVHNCGPDDHNGLTTCIEKAAFSYEVVSGTPTLEARLTFQNQGSGQGRIQNVTSDLLLHDRSVAHGAGASFVSLPKGAMGDVLVSYPLDGKSLEAWWPTHVQSCERSSVELPLHFTWVEDGVITQVDWAFAGADFVTRFLCQA